MIFRDQHPRIAAQQDLSWAMHGSNSYLRMIHAYAFCSKLLRENESDGKDAARFAALIGAWANLSHAAFIKASMPESPTVEDARKVIDVMINTFKLPTPVEMPPEGDVVVTKTADGQIVAVTRQDEEGHILSVIAESAPRKHDARTVEAMAEQLILAAQKAGVVVTIDLKPREELRMGNYDMRIQVRNSHAINNLVQIEWFRVVKGSSFDDAMVDEEWASEPLSRENAEVRCNVLNEKCGEHSRCYHTVRPENYTLYEFQP